jgi:BMFP domain-containing protein YqiC
VRSRLARVALSVGMVAVAVASGGCRGQRDRREAEELIRAYSRALIEAHLTGSHEQLDKLTSRDESDRVQVLVMGLRAKNEQLIASLEALEVRSAALDLEKKAGTASAEERWRYRRIDRKTRQPTFAEVVRSYEAKYAFTRKDGRWVVDRVLLEAPETAPK